MISSEKEKVEFVKPAKIRNMGVEGWLNLVKDEMINTLSRRIKEALADLNKESTDKNEWVMKHCGQAIAVVAMINWTEQTELAIQEMEDDPFQENPVLTHLKYTQMGLSALVGLIR